MFAALGRLSIGHLAAAQALAVRLCTRLLLVPVVLHARVQKPFGAAPDLLHTLCQPGRLVLSAQNGTHSVSSGIGAWLKSSLRSLGSAAIAARGSAQGNWRSLRVPLLHFRSAVKPLRWQRVQGTAASQSYMPGGRPHMKKAQIRLADRVWLGWQ